VIGLAAAVFGPACWAACTARGCAARWPRCTPGLGRGGRGTPPTAGTPAGLCRARRRRRRGGRRGRSRRRWAGVGQAASVAAGLLIVLWGVHASSRRWREDPSLPVPGALRRGLQAGWPAFTRRVRWPGQEFSPALRAPALRVAVGLRHHRGGDRERRGRRGADGGVLGGHAPGDARGGRRRAGRGRPLRRFVPQCAPSCWWWWGSTPWSTAPGSTRRRAPPARRPAVTPLAEPRRASPACAHCGLPVPPALGRADGTESFCCAGCDTVWHALRANGLDSYYALRAQAGETGAPHGRRGAPTRSSTTGVPRALVRLHPDGLARPTCTSRESTARPACGWSSGCAPWGRGSLRSAWSSRAPGRR